SQVRLILKPVADQLLMTLGKARTEKKLNKILSIIRQTYSHIPSYAGGNILNMLVQMGYDLRGYDFSHLVIWQAYLQGVSLPEVNFSYANLEKSVFSDAFGSILSLVFSPNGEFLA